MLVIGAFFLFFIYNGMQKIQQRWLFNIILFSRVNGKTCITCINFQYLYDI